MTQLHRKLRKTNRKTGKQKINFKNTKHRIREAVDALGETTGLVGICLPGSQFPHL